MFFSVVIVNLSHISNPKQNERNLLCNILKRQLMTPTYF